MTDIAKRLRRQVIESPYDGFVSPLEAADEIERLEADNARLKAALNKIMRNDPEGYEASIAREAAEAKDD